MTRKHRVMFICVGNSCRSQMAEGFARHHGSDVLEVRSGGTMPSGQISRDAVAVMAEKGIDISRQHSGPIDLEFAAAADSLFTMGCSAEGACPAHIIPRIVDWGFEDPIGKPIEEFRRVRDQVETKVLAFINDVRDGRA